MPCYYPLKAWKGPGKTGALSICWTRQGSSHVPVELPCGQCIGCRLERSRQWALRCMHEASLYSDSCFVTFSYSEAHLPKDFSLSKRHFQLFMKRLRKKFRSVRFFHCGEYGEDTKRPHYHALLFNVHFSDRVFLKANGRGDRLYTSETLDRLWGLGSCWIGAVTFESAAYVARYVTKKVTGADALFAYERVSAETGEVWQVQPEYATMSLKPGIGAGWYERHRKEVYPSDFVVRDGVRMLPPTAYDRWLERDTCPHWFEYYGLKPPLSVVRTRRVRKAKRHASDNTPERLRVREAVKLSQVKSLKRGLE